MITFHLDISYHDSSRDQITKQVSWPVVPSKKQRIMIGECFLTVGWVLHDLDSNEIRVHCNLGRANSKELFELLLKQHGFRVRGT